ncbi:short-chain dehydrogenase [Flavobacterium sp. IR1]|jgi:NAD(P)-dependent dehydrogenase (short-subunit alcohol dehydrogenase family)|uniref:Glucose 1-dehydrogenase n=1 Tax=Flavobacterium hydrocarbonoxydans TaxID=2683249 RepID=A0A6I4NNY1_9FLAO|nr:glucose 1-dehydrogenase [Flavobacterium hydrocarbonoxydans]MWB92797.1 glucose 1-dehydrogenase [Flavobacterium hydrocarbonoxydans]PAM91796.1 short-chain dehydrogenase [Flavobacterium sp. IR1]
MNKTVIITGGTTGIGKATAIHFAKNGYNVVVTSRNADKETSVIADFKENGVDVAFFPLDVTQEKQVESVIQETVKKFGKLDSIVNNSGISLGNAILAETKSEELKQMLDTNVMGVYYGMKYAIIEMLKTGGGTIVNLASIAGLNGLYATAQYNASKHAVVGLTKGTAIDYAQQGIRVNAVAPGAIKTDILKNAIASGTYDVSSIEAIHPMNRLGEVEDIAKAIYFLASDENTFMTGTILNIDGGYNAK